MRPAEGKRQLQTQSGRPETLGANWRSTAAAAAVGDELALDTTSGALQAAEERSGQGGGVGAAAAAGAAAAGLRPPAGQFNQLFGGDSRFVINGSSLQIRSPSRRHDETLFVCLRRPAAGARARSIAQANAVHQSSLAGAACLSHLFGQPAAVAAAGVALKQQAAGEQAAKQLQPRVSSISIRIVGK